jgi:TPR repeat protein
MPKWVVLSMMAVAVMATPVLGDFSTGMAAFKRGDDATAVREWTEAAESGNPDAQLQLATLYRSGMGVERNDEEAVRWYTRAAEQGVVEAQSSLGFMHRSGRGAPRDEVRAYFWLSLAAENGDTDARDARDRIARKLDRDRLREAETLIWKWRKRR